MLDEFAKEIMSTLISEMKAVTSDAHPDHKARIAAVKESRSFLLQLLPKLSQEDRQKVLHALSAEFAAKLGKTLVDEVRLETPAA
jgi:N-methylhydantoinase B/oxoprolinase/acetone carboxylase alpha subunit